MVTYYEDDDVKLLHGDALEKARELPDKAASCIVTSPPYYGLRNYGSPYQYGGEETPALYVETLRALFAELRRVLTDDGTLWLNLGDSYSGGRRKTYADTGKAAGRIGGERPVSGIPGKNLLGMPWRVAFALQDDGWTLRNSIIWHKTNAMPESVQDRLSGRHENIFLFSKSPKYHFELDAIREPHKAETTLNTKGKNPGDVWAIPTKGFRGAHFATFPPELPRRCILAGSKPGDTILDPFSGSATTGMVALEEGRKYIGIDSNADYLKLSLETRLAATALNIEETA